MMVGERISIVKDTPGVTRDRIYADVTWLNHSFTLMDTGGIEPETNDLMLKHMREQAEMAIEMADVVLFLTDGKTGLVDADYQVADMLRKSHKKVVLVVNKIDNFENRAWMFTSSIIWGSENHFQFPPSARSVWVRC